MSNVRVVHHAEAYHALRSEPGPVGDLEARAARVKRAAEAGGGKYVMGSRQGMRAPQGRWRTSVVTADPKAMRKNAKHHTLLTALDAARG